MKDSTLVLSVVGAVGAILLTFVGSTLISGALTRVHEEKLYMACLENQRTAIENQKGKDAWKWSIPDCRR